jgi:uncharacterized glyoxalase superfamily protein PhnB
MTDPDVGLSAVPDGRHPAADEPFPDAPEYGRSLPGFTVNLLVRDPRPSADFYREVLDAQVRFVDRDFAALVINGTAVMLHADRTYAQHPWSEELRGDVRRGLGAELRVLGLDPDRVQQAAQEAGGTVLQPAQDKPHGWRETVVADPEGYTWAVGRRLG